MNLTEFKKFFLFSLIGSLVVSALVAVINILVGSFNNEITHRVLLTLFMVIFHSLFSLGFIWDNERKNTFEDMAFFTNVLFFLIVASFITSVFGIWKIISGELVWHLYETYFLIGFASLHGDILSKVLRKEDYMDNIVYLNYVFMVTVVLMLLPVIYIHDATRILPEFYFRLLGAAGIIDGTLSILAVIFHKLYMNKHPKLDNPLETSFQGQTGGKLGRRGGLSIWVWILLTYLVIQIVLPMVFYTVGRRFF